MVHFSSLGDTVPTTKTTNISPVLTFSKKVRVSHQEMARGQVVTSTKRFHSAFTSSAFTILYNIEWTMQLVAFIYECVTWIRSSTLFCRV